MRHGITTLRSGGHKRRLVLVAAAAGCLALAGAATAAIMLPAKVLFSHVSTPSAGAPRPIGFYAKGCLAGADPLPLDGPHWQVMRLSRNRHWGMPELVSYIEKLSDAAAGVGWNGLLVGDMSQPRGGPMPTGHASHQIGLDVDLWFTPMPDRTLTPEERETMGATSLLIPGRLAVDPKKWSPVFARMLQQATAFPEVERIFVSPAIKKQLCQTGGTNTAWLRKLRPWAGHDDHFHVRLACPAGVAGCDEQAPPPPGDGCDASLEAWFKPPPPPPPPPTHPVKPRPPPPPITLADLPKACASVLDQGRAPGAVQAAAVPLPRVRPAAN